MATTVSISELRARLGQYLDAVRNGRVLTVLDRGTPVVRIVPYGGEHLEVRRATRRPVDLVLPSRTARRTDSVGIIRDDRRRR